MLIKSTSFVEFANRPIRSSHYFPCMPRVRYLGCSCLHEDVLPTSEYHRRSLSMASAAPSRLLDRRLGINSGLRTDGIQTKNSLFKSRVCVKNRGVIFSFISEKPKHEKSVMRVFRSLCLARKPLYSSWPIPFFETPKDQHPEKLCGPFSSTFFRDKRGQKPHSLGIHSHPPEQANRRKHVDFSLTASSFV